MGATKLDGGGGGGGADAVKFYPYEKAEGGGDV